MDPIVTGLTNLGGMGLAAAMLWVLHRDALKSFREELKAERDANQINIERLVDKMQELTEAVRGILHGKP